MTLVNVGYTGNLGTPYAGGAWVYTGGALGYPPGRPPPVEARFRVRQVVLAVYVNGVELDDVQWVRCRFSLTEPVASAELVCPTRHGNYNQTVRIFAGTIPGSGLLLRFDGLMGNPNADLFPRSVSHAVVGQLARAARFFPSEGVPMPSGGFGLFIPNILGIAGTWVEGSTDQWTEEEYNATAGQIITAVLNMSGMSGLFDPADIWTSNVLYGEPDITVFKWETGAPHSIQVMPTVARESALNYIGRYDEIDAQWGGPANFWEGGFFRTTEGLGGRVYRRRFGGKPASLPGGDWSFRFTEGYNLLEGSKIERKYPLGNRAWVQGWDSGHTSGGWRFLAQRNNAFMSQDSNHVIPSAPSSPMISWRTIDGGSLTDGGQILTDGTIQNTALRVAAGLVLPFVGALVGQNCETVAEAVLVDGNKETPAGQVVTVEDAPFTQGVSVLVQGTLGGGVDRLLSGEAFLIEGLTFDCGHGPNGEPLIKQTLDVAGGGLDANRAQLVGGVLTQPVLLDQLPPGVPSTPMPEDPAGPLIPLDAALL